MPPPQLQLLDPPLGYIASIISVAQGYRGAGAPSKSDQFLGS